MIMGIPLGQALLTLNEPLDLPPLTRLREDLKVHNSVLQGSTNLCLSSSEKEISCSAGCDEYQTLNVPYRFLGRFWDLSTLFRHWIANAECQMMSLLCGGLNHCNNRQCKGTEKRCLHETETHVDWTGIHASSWLQARVFHLIVLVLIVEESGHGQCQLLCRVAAGDEGVPWFRNMKEWEEAFDKEFGEDFY